MNNEVRRTRPSTGDEIATRVRSVTSFIGFAAYGLIGVGGSFAFSHLVHDEVWNEIFLGFWWIPSGIAAFLLKHWIDGYLLHWIPLPEEERGRDRKSLSE
jgi:hypothetical protein